MGVKTQMMTVIVDSKMERIISTFGQDVKSLGLGDCLVVGSKGEEGVRTRASFLYRATECS